MNIRDFAKEQLFFLSSLLLSIERIKIKQTDVLLKTLTLNWLIPLKEVYNNRDSFPSLEHYTQQLHTNTKSSLL
jgi:hypothetical protein